MIKQSDLLSVESIWAPSPSTIRGQPTPISADPKGERVAYAVSSPKHAYSNHLQILIEVLPIAE